MIPPLLLILYLKSVTRTFSQGEKPSSDKDKTEQKTKDDKKTEDKKTDEKKSEGKEEKKADESKKDEKKDTKKDDKKDEKLENKTAGAKVCIDHVWRCPLPGVIKKMCLDLQGSNLEKFGVVSG